MPLLNPSANDYRTEIPKRTEEGIGNLLRRIRHSANGPNSLDEETKKLREVYYSELHKH